MKYLVLLLVALFMVLHGILWYVWIPDVELVQQQERRGASDVDDDDAADKRKLAMDGMPQQVRKRKKIKPATRVYEARDDETDEPDEEAQVDSDTAPTQEPTHEVLEREPTHEPTHEPTQDDATQQTTQQEPTQQGSTSSPTTAVNNEKNTNFVLRCVLDEYMHPGHSDQGVAGVADISTLEWKEPGVLLVDVASSDEDAGTQLQPVFDTYGFEVTGCVEYQCSGYLPITTLPSFEAHDEVKFIRPSIPMSSQAGSVVSEAVRALQVDELRQAFPRLTGAGLRIGILSDSFDTRNGAAADIASGDVPRDVTIVKEMSRTGIDEGRAMAQLVHDLVPRTKIFFRTAFEGNADFANGIRELADAGCDVIVDDIGYLLEPFFQDGVIAQAANDVAELRDIPYFSSAGNSGTRSFEGTFSRSGKFDVNNCELHDFGNGNTRQRIFLEGDARISFQWEDPFFSVSGSPGASRDMDIRAYSQGRQIASDITKDQGNDPVAFLVLSQVLGPVELEFSLCTRGKGLPRMKWIAFGRVSSIQFDTKSSTSFGHPNMPFTAGVGAAFFQQTPAFGTDPPQLQSFSSRGGTPILFERNGRKKARREIRKQPRFVAPDGCINTFFGVFTTFAPNGSGYYFFGTSAASPNAASVAIMMLQANPDLTPSDIYAILEDTAINMNKGGFDFDSGHGLVDADAAVRAALAAG